ncbi:MAG: four helix bundle protein [Acidobacteria bacterium]|nr:four helix bundle protein [Acidobacteriota bacterium]
MGKTTFEDLEVYQLSEKLADLIWEIVSNWDHFSKGTVGKQLVESCDSISANIAEGCGRFNYKDNGRFIKISRGSLYETKSWLRRAYRRRLLTEADVDRLKPILDELLPKLNAHKRAIDKAAKDNN